MKRILSLLLAGILSLCLILNIDLRAAEANDAPPAQEPTIPTVPEIPNYGSRETDPEQKVQPIYLGEPEKTDPETPETPPYNDAFAAYVDARFCPGHETRKNAAGNRLEGTPRAVYDKLASLIAEVANGTRSLTIFPLPADELSLTENGWTAEALGVVSLFEDGAITADAMCAAQGRIAEMIQLDAVHLALLADYPYELYWYDKTKGVSYGLSYAQVDDRVFVDEITFYFSVSEAFCADDYEVNTAFGQAVETAVATAQSIVDRYAAFSDYEKLDAYLFEICDRTSYNIDACNPSTPYGNPWQLIWVFDDDPSTEVVCEGYSKAFQYLCDRSDFQSDQICCITVTGTLQCNYNGGPHMWNIVCMDDGKNYLADLTNCDEGSIGMIHQLFLNGYDSGDADFGYRFVCTYHGNQQDAVYHYDDSTRALYSETMLALSDTAYAPTTAPNLYYADSFALPEDYTCYMLCSLAAPICKKALTDGYIGFAMPVEASLSEEIGNLLVTRLNSNAFTCLLLDFYMEEYPELADKYGSVYRTFDYVNGYLIFRLKAFDASTPRTVALYAEETHIADYVSISAALAAAADAGLKNPIVYLTYDRPHYLPRTAETDAFDSLRIEQIDFAFETECGIVAHQLSPVILLGDICVSCDLTLNYIFFCPMEESCLSIGNHTVTLEGIVMLGIINTEYGTNLDTGSGELWTLEGGEGSRLVIEDDSQCDFTGTLTIDQLVLRKAYFFAFRGGDVYSSVNELIVEEVSEQHSTTVCVGVNVVSDSVHLHVGRISVLKDYDYCSFDVPHEKQQLIIDDFVNENGGLSIHCAMTSGLINGDEFHAELSEVSILCERLPARLSVFQYQLDFFVDEAFDINEIRNWIPKGTRLMRIPHLNPDLYRITLSTQINYNEDWSIHAFKQFSYEICLDDEGYVVRGDEMTAEWIGDYYVVLNRDKTYSLYDLNSDLRGDLNLPETVDGVTVTQTGADDFAYFRQYMLREDKLGRWNSGKATFPATYQKIANFTFNSFDQVLFLGPKPIFDDETNEYRDKTVVYYLPEYADSWAPNGETSLNGMMLEPYIEPDPDPLPGDANADGVVNAADAATVLRYVVGLGVLSAQGMRNADVDGNDGITAQDALAILQYLVGLIDVLPAA